MRKRRAVERGREEGVHLKEEKEEKEGEEEKETSSSG